MQLGCNKTSQRLLWAPKRAIGAVICQTVTCESSAVTALCFVGVLTGNSLVCQLCVLDRLIPNLEQC